MRTKVNSTGYLIFSVLCSLEMSSFAQSVFNAPHEKDAQHAVEEVISKPWTVVPSYSYSFFNKGRDSWQRESLDIYYQVNKQLLLGTSVDFHQRPPNSDDFTYSFNASWYPRRHLEVHGEVSVTPDAHFLANERYALGLEYTLNPKVTLLFDVERLEFDSSSTRPDFQITQIKPGVSYWLTDKTALTLRYTHGWLHNESDYDYYSASVKFVDLPRDAQLTVGVAYGTDPDLDFGTIGATLSDAYTCSVFYKQPLKPDLSIYAGVEYVYRMRADTNGELYQRITPTIGLSWKF